MARYGGHSPHSSMVHCNGNLLCAVDVETTGLDPKKHDLIQICVLPLDAQLQPIQNIVPFYTEMQPKRPENIDPKATKTHRLNMAELIRRAIDPWKAVDLFEEWFEALHLPEKRKIMPLASNWPFDREFIVEWLGGPLSYEFFFHGHFRDTQAVALYMNDRADHHVEKCPFPKVGLEYCCSVFGVTNQKAHDALYDCLATAEVYRQMLLMPTL